MDFVLVRSLSHMDLFVFVEFLLCFFYEDILDNFIYPGSPHLLIWNQCRKIIFLRNLLIELDIYWLTFLFSVTDRTVTSLLWKDLAIILWHGNLLKWLVWKWTSHEMRSIIRKNTIFWFGKPYFQGASAVTKHQIFLLSRFDRMKFSIVKMDVYFAEENIWCGLKVLLH